MITKAQEIALNTFLNGYDDSMDFDQVIDRIRNYDSDSEIVVCGLFLDICEDVLADIIEQLANDIEKSFK